MKKDAKTIRRWIDLILRKEEAKFFPNKNLTRFLCKEITTKDQNELQINYTNAVNYIEEAYYRIDCESTKELIRQT